jgi:recombination protein RecA
MAKRKPGWRAQVHQLWGEGAVFTYGDRPLACEVIPTGALPLDKALGVGGVPRGRIVEIFGPESGGKTTLLLHIVANAQALGYKAAFIDAEHGLDAAYARAIGVDITKLVVSQPDYGEMALGIVETLAASGEFAVIGIDSVAALVPKAELDGEMGASHMGLHARLMSQAMRKLCGVCGRTKTMLVFINQTRMNIGGGFSYTTTTGGNALKFYASQRVNIKRIDTLKTKDGRAVANRTLVKVVKNKLAPPFMQCEFNIEYGVGICKGSCALEAGAAMGVVDKSGAWYSYEGVRIAQGYRNAALALRNDPVLLAAIEDDILMGGV